MVLDEQDAPPGARLAQQLVSARRRRDGRGRRRSARERLDRRLHDRQRHADPEGAALPWRALDTDLPAHERRQALADREPEPGSAVLLRHRAVGLLESLEDAQLFGGIDPDALIDHLQAQVNHPALRGNLAGAHDDVAGIGELHRVGEEIDQDLGEADRIAGKRTGQHRVDLAAQAQTLVTGALAHQGHRTAHEIGQDELGALDPELSGFDLRQVEDVVDDAEQVMGRALDLAEAIAAAPVAALAQQQFRQADDRVHRRADLMAHVGEEGALGAAGGLGLVARLGKRRSTFAHHGLEVLAMTLEFGFDLLARADVALHRQHVGFAAPLHPAR